MAATSAADIVAEALAVGLQYTTDDGLLYDGSGKLRPPRHLLVEPDGVRVVDTSSDRGEALAMAAEEDDCSVYYRDDVVDAALAHVAERCAAETKRAEEARERAIQRIVEVLDIVNRYEHCADARRAIEALVSRVEDAGEAAPRG